MLTFTFEQTKSTRVASSSPMYSTIFLLIHGRMRFSIRVWEKYHEQIRLNQKGHNADTHLILKTYKFLLY